MTYTGPAGSPEGDGALPTRREARARREAADLAAAPASSMPVPVPPAPLAESPDLAVVVESAVPAGPAQSSITAGHALPRSPFLHRAPRSTPTSSRSTTPAGARRVGPPASGSPRRAAGRRTPVAKIVTLLAIPAIFLTAALPAYAFSPEGGSAAITAPASGEAQGLTVAAAAAAVSISADGFSATSQADIDRAEAALQADIAQKAAERSAAAGFAVYGIRAEGDDYPWMSAATQSEGGGLSPLGYYYRECVDFVAWRLNRDAGASGSPWKWTWGNLTPGGGNGDAWARNWAAKGRATGQTPVVGAVATFTYNHVAYVQSVPGDGTVVLEEYNWMGSHAYHTRTVPISAVKLFLYPPT